MLNSDTPPPAHTTKHLNLTIEPISEKVYSCLVFIILFNQSGGSSAEHERSLKFSPSKC